MPERDVIADMKKTNDYWVGYFSATLTLIEAEGDEHAAKLAKDALNAYRETRDA